MNDVKGSGRGSRDKNVGCANSVFKKGLVHVLAKFDGILFLLKMIVLIYGLKWSLNYRSVHA